ncbi:unnamed protein product, partial [Phaeothamnion confervicola]
QVFVPDPDIAWCRATVLKAHGDGNRFDVRVETEAADECEPSQRAGDVATVDLRHPDFIGMESLPLQNIGLPREGVRDMCSLNYLHEPAILYNIRHRFFAQLPYTYTGDICIAVNPYQWLKIYGDELRAQYQRAIKKSDLPPHVYATSAHAYKGLREYGKNQSILVSGESGAGKTETVKILLNHLASIAGGEDDTTIERVVKTHPLLEGFGNAKTVRNDNSSRFGKFTELQFDASCRLAGSSINTYLLEKTRVVQHSAGERTYHIFYQLLAAPDVDKARFGVGGLSKFDLSYTGMGRDDATMIEGKTDAERFGETVKALQLIGLDQIMIDLMFNAISAILHLGQLSFAPHKEHGHDGSEIAEPRLLAGAAAPMGTSPASLGQHLTHRSMTARGETVNVPLTPNQAAESRDGLAKEIYFRLFDWLVTCINASTALAGGKRPAGTISLLDIFGFESFVHNSFEQFCINYANEKLQQKFTLDTFKTVEYQEEGIPWSHIAFKDNAHVLALIEGKTTGLLSLLDEECRVTKGTDEAFTSKAAKQHSSHESFSRGRLMGATEFTVRHYAGAVTYDSTSFLDKNRDTLQDDLTTMLAGSENVLIKTIFESGGAVAAAAGGVAVHNRKGSLMQESVGSKFKRQLHSLMGTIQTTQVQYVRCIKPNTVKSSKLVESNMVVEQLRCAGVIEAIRISRAAYPNRLPFDEFTFRFQVLSGMANKGRGGGHKQHADGASAASLCRSIIARLLPRAEEQYAIGNTKVYFRAGVLEELEERRGVFMRKQVLTLQRVLMGNVQRRRFLRLRAAAVVVQARTRGYLGRR